MQDLCRYPKPESLYPHRSRESYSWYVVSGRVDESHRERVRGVENSRSVALGGNNRRIVQRVRRHVFKDQTRSQRLPPPPPPDCVTDEQKQRYIEEYYQHEGIRLDPKKIEYNPGLRYLAKLVLNSLWGKYTMLFHNVNPR